MFYRIERFYVLIAFAMLAVFLYPSLLPTEEIDPPAFRALSLSEQLQTVDNLSGKKDLAEIKKLLQASYPDEPQDRHELAHKFGEIAIAREGISGFGSCGPFLAYGCFHGAALAAVRVYGYDSGLSAKLWDGCRKKAPEPGVCLHGLGHAIMVIRQYDLLGAYEECEKILSKDDAFWCQDGASMENIERSMANAEMKPYGDLHDIYSPCNSLPQKYETVCVKNHIGFARKEFSWTEEQSASFCLSYANKNTQSQCTEMLGSIWMSENWNSKETVATLCKTTKHPSECILGAVTTLSMARRYGEAGSLCESIGGKKEHVACKNRIESLKKFSGEE